MKTHSSNHPDRPNPKGRHTLWVRLVAPRDTRCLVRVRQPDVDTEALAP